MIETTHCITKKIAKRKLIFFDRTDDLNPFEIMLNIDVLKKEKLITEMRYLSKEI